MFDVELHFLSLLGSLAISLFLLKDYISKSLKESHRKLQTGAYLRPRLAVMIINILLAQIIVVVQEYGVDFYADIRGDSALVDLYIDHAEFISFMVGIFSATLFGIFINTIKSKIPNQ